MKRLLALMSVCAGLTALAGVPRVNTGLPMIRPAVERAAASVSPIRSAALGVTSNDMTGGRIVFLHQYACVEEAGGVMQAVACDPQNVGGWTTTLTTGADGRVTANEGILLEVAQPLVIDAAAGTVTLVADNTPFATTTASSTSTVAGTVIKMDTTINYYVVNEDWMLNQGPLADVTGEILADGSIVIADGFGYYIETVITRSVTSKGETTVTTDTKRNVSPLLRDTRLMKPNGKHEFKNESDGQTRTVDVYMYQNGGKVYVMNLYGYGWGENYMELNADGTMSYPAQPLRDLVDADYPSGDGVWRNMTYENGVATDGNVGTVTPTAITWGLTVPGDGDGLWYGWYDNRLFYTDGSRFVIPSDVIRGDVNGDGDVTIADVSALIDALLSGDYSTIVVANADTNQDNDIQIGDVSALIDFLLGGTWQS